MNTVTIEVRTLAETLDDVVEARSTLTPSEPRISFETLERADRQALGNPESHGRIGTPGAARDRQTRRV